MIGLQGKDKMACEVVVGRKCTFVPDCLEGEKHKRFGINKKKNEEVAKTTQIGDRRVRNMEGLDSKTEKSGTAL